MHRHVSERIQQIQGCFNINFYVQFRITLKSRTKTIPHCVVKFEASEENRTVQESLHCEMSQQNERHFAVPDLGLGLPACMPQRYVVQ